MVSLRDSGKLFGGATVRQVARRCQLPVPISLRRFIAARGCPFDRCIRLHIKVLEAPNHPVERMLDAMRVVYGTAAIRVAVASRENLRGSEFDDLLEVTVPEDDEGNACPAGETSDEQDQLFENRNGVNDNDIVIYFVRSTDPALNGCASHPRGRPGAIVTRGASIWTLAHEVGHVLGLEHITGENEGCPNDMPDCCRTADFTRLMTGCGTNGITDTPTVDAEEIETMRESALVRQC